jgi:hypothetical protein
MAGTAKAERQERLAPYFFSPATCSFTGTSALEIFHEGMLATVRNASWLKPEALAPT